MIQLRLIGGVLLGLALALTGCGGQTTTSAGATSNALDDQGAVTGSGGDDTSGGATTTAGDATSTATNDALELSVSNKPDLPQYNEGVLSAPVGSPLIVTYTNPSEEAHNWVLVEPGQEQAVADAAAANGGNPEGIADVIAWSETISGDSATVEVPPLEAQGGYPYICTVPGHFAAGHRGALDVK